MKTPPFPLFSVTAITRVVALLGLLGAAIPQVHAAPACHVDSAGAVPPGCMGTSTWFGGTGQYEPAIIHALNGGQYATPGGLVVVNANTPNPGGNSGTRGIFAAGQGMAPIVPSRVNVAGDTTVDITVTNTDNPNPTANEGVYADQGAEMTFNGSLGVVTFAQASATHQAVGVASNGQGVGTLAGTGSKITVTGALAVNTTQALFTPFAMQASNLGAIVLQNGGTVESAKDGIAAWESGTLNASGNSMLTVTTDNVGVVVNGSSSGPATAVTLDNATIKATHSGVVLTSVVNSGANNTRFTQNGGSISSAQGSAIVFTGTGWLSATLNATTIQSQASPGAGPDGYASGLAVYGGASTAALFATNSTLNGPISLDDPNHLWVTLDHTMWNTGGSPGTTDSSRLTKLSGNGTISMPDINDTITLLGDAAYQGDQALGCGDAALTLVVPTNQPAPPSSPHTVMVCRNAASSPSMALQGGTVVLGGFSYTLQTVPADGRVLYQLVRGAPAADVQATPVPTLTQWGVVLLSGLLGLMGFAGMRRRDMRH